jgi:hypothetical protein
MRKVAYFFLILFFAVSAFAVFVVAMTVNTARKTAEPVGELVRNLVVPATAVIMPDPVVLVQEVRDLARLETASYTLEKVITAERDQDRLWGLLGESLIFVAHGDVVAGVDLSKMREADIQVVDPETVLVHLPEAEIFNVILDNDLSYVVDRDTGLLARSDPQLETNVRRAAQDELEKAAAESDILETANDNARNYMEGFLRSLGFTTITFTDGPPPPAPPYVQEVPKGYAVTPAAP